MALALILTIPFVATAPVVEEVIASNDPVVSPAPVEAIRKPCPVVSVLAWIFWTVPAVVALAVMFKKPMFDVEV